MALLDFFSRGKEHGQHCERAPANHRRGAPSRRRGAALSPQLRKDILEVICKYVQIDPEMVSVQLEQRDGDISILS